MALTAVDVAERLAAVRARIEAAGGSPDHVAIVAVTKGFGPEVAGAALAAGLADLGENYAQELAAKHAALTAAQSPPAQSRPAQSHATWCWHFLGHVQRNKVRDLAGLVELWQGVDRAPAGAEIARRAPGAKVLVQVNVSGEAAKNGCTPADVDGLVDTLRDQGLEVRGLMAVGPGGPPEAAGPGFRLLAATADRLGLAERSMGMSDDVEVAVGEGSTMLRVGRALFGPRSGRVDLQR